MLDEEVLNVTNPFSMASIVSNTTLAFIAFSAGSEMHIPSLGKSQLKAIRDQVVA